MYCRGGDSIKNIPNYISIARILASIGLVFVKPLSSLFFFLYIVCGVSDALDGYIARRLGVSSKFGQVLDSVADLIFIGIVLLIFIPIINLPQWILIWIIIIALIRFLSIIIGYIKYRQISFLHTIANKFTGLVLFFFPMFFAVLGRDLTAILICCIASISATEELIITVTSKTLERDIKSILVNGPKI